MNWGNRILLVIVVFLIGMGTMVFIAMQQTNEMMDDNYYAKELVYQEIVTAKKNLKASAVQLSVTQNNAGLQISLPPTSGLQEGNIQLMRTAKQNLDINIPIANSIVYTVPAAKLQKGAYLMRTRWKANDTEYYDERDIIIE